MEEQWTGYAWLMGEVWRDRQEWKSRTGNKWLREKFVEINWNGRAVDWRYIHWRVRTTSELSHHTVTCLVQLASLSGHVIVNDKEIRIQYLTNYIKNFLHLVTSVNILDREALGISNIVRKMILFFPTSILICLPSELLQSFLEQLAKLTCQFAEGAAQEESVCADDCLYMEAFDHMLEAWISVLHNSQEFPKDFCKQSAMQIFNTYLKCHLSPPDGTRGQGRELDVEEIDDTEENDRTKFQDQLMTIGVVGRHVPGHSLTILCKLLEERTRRLYGQLQRLHSQAMNISDNSILDCLFEDIHWLVLIAGRPSLTEAKGADDDLAHDHQPSHSQPTGQTLFKLVGFGPDQSPVSHLHLTWFHLNLYQASQIPGYTTWG
uniref:Uncharacterized protein n=1 Tax=Timema cristinae TaxID=61476 RepID=A0A7R9GUY0_TIMCR|nr:unnamed protein product [Timema cristinae]